MAMERWVLAWYGWLSTLTQGFVVGLQDWTAGVELPLVMAAVLGVIAAASPCQLTTNVGALAYASAQAERRSPLTLAAAYVAGKVSVYALVGALVVVAGLRLDAASIPVISVARKALGPLMLVVGLSLLGLLPMKGRLGQGLAFGLRQRVSARGPLGAYLLGVAFSFAFCPTLFWLFFGLTIPLAVRSSGGWVFPGVFAVGSSLPLLALAGALAAGLGSLDHLTGGMRRVERPLRIAGGVVLVLAGLHDTLIYWLL
jgi:cytochrome c biogenesis protein CcdA